MNQQQHQTRNLQRRGPCWFEHEINQLLQLVNEHGQDWNKIGTLLETKTAQDCRKKFAELNNIPPIQPIVPIVIPPQNNANNVQPAITVIIPYKLTINFLLNPNPKMDIIYILNKIICMYLLYFII
ncbi:unnamed protein product [Rhizophagus irregularis]|nr:unnamed protein product [Rhizophagus irregularis]CAB4412391.1 unnamed protein product [Rhizophagus irregularis]